MLKKRKVEDKEVNGGEMESDNFNVEEYEGFSIVDDDEFSDFYDSGLYEDGDEIGDPFDENSAGVPWIISDRVPPDEINRSDCCLDNRWMLISRGQERLDLPVIIEPQDADYYELPQLSDEFGNRILPRIPIELETMILARIGILECRKLCLLNKRFSALVKNGDLLRERRMIGHREAVAFMFASGEQNWLAFDQNFTSHKVLPVLPSDDVLFTYGDKESLCAGSHLLVCGSEMDGPVIWTYEVLLNKWFKGSSMIQSRCLFASASCGDYAFVAGGIGLETNGILNSAEKYDPESRSWIKLPEMNKKRKMCAGAYMDNKFYVIGGRNLNEDALTCADVFNQEQNEWKQIPGMLNGLAVEAFQSPPLVAVVDNELYLFEPSSNCLMVYLKNSNSWKNLGSVPVRAYENKGWGVAFKSLGNELLVIGGSNFSSSGRGMNIYSCYPNPNANPSWKQVLDGRNRSHFVRNCTVMLV